MESARLAKHLLMVGGKFSITWGEGVFFKRRYLCRYFGLSQWSDIVIAPNVLMSLARAWPITKYPATFPGFD